jgi:hypothetical protein
MNEKTDGKQAVRAKAGVDHRLFVLTAWGALCVFFTGVHSVVYNWAFLPKYADASDLSVVITFELILAYLSWMPGAILVTVNLALVLGFVIYLWRMRP